MLNRADFIGRVSRYDVADSYVRFTIACNRKTQNGEETEWVQCVAFSPLSDTLKKLQIEKGVMLFVSGRIKTSKSEKGYSWSLICRDVTVLSPKGQAQKTNADATNINGVVNEEDIPF